MDSMQCFAQVAASLAVALHPLSSINILWKMSHKKIQVWFESRGIEAPGTAAVACGRHGLGSPGRGIGPAHLRVAHCHRSTFRPTLIMESMS